jgi:pimeloyl-ACP methyl ester carboxylesterase
MTRHHPTRSARMALVALVVAIALPLAGCASWFLPPNPRPTSTPVAEAVDPALESFYTQVLVWKPCKNGKQCTTATAPMDWKNPATGSVKLALIRQAATDGNPLGSLLINPGGPGVSGFDFLADSIDFAISKRLQKRFDVVGFDPRGVGRSSAVTCYDKPSELDSYLFDISPFTVGTDEWITDVENSSREFGKQCLKHTGPLLGFVDTVSAARDLDLLRAILGDAKLNYLGYSYGTLLGATFADLYPAKTGRLVLDGVVDPATTSFEVTATQAQGFESAMRAFLADCFQQQDCPFSGTVDESMTQVRTLLQTLDVSPLQNSDGRQLGSGAMFTAIILPLYSKTTWQSERDLFTSVFSGDASFAFQLADAYFGRNPDGTYADNSSEAITAINCLDYPTNGSVALMRKEAAELEKLAPVFGPQMSWGATGCSTWPLKSTRTRGPIAAKGSGPILVVGTTNDPATPYVWAQNLAKQLENGHLVTLTGEGHTGYNKGNACVDDTVDNYFLDGTVPKTDPQC